jgi:hypothetical protein
MPSVHATLGAPWDDGATAHLAGFDMPWKDGVTVHAGMSTYTPGSPPGGGTPTGPTAASLFEIAARPTYNVVHEVSLTDLRDDTVLDVTDLAIAADEDSVFWTLRATGPGLLYAKLTSGAQPAQVEATIDGVAWRFAVDSVGRSRGFESDSVSFTGRSLTVAASSPYQVDSNWVNDGETTAAQMAAIANIYTGLEVVWMLDDWVIPDQIFTFTGTPLGVVRRVAEAVGAMVVSDRSEFRVVVTPRYPILPNEWPVAPVDVQIAFEAVQLEQFERADRPEYDGVYLSGQQGGATGFVRLAGTAGATLHPLVTDLLLTEEPALRQRGMAILGQSGGQARVSLTLPVLTGAGEPGVLDLNQIVRVLDPAGTWFGLVRSVSVSASSVEFDPRVRQVVVLERHTKLLTGTYIPPGETDLASNPLVFAGPIADQALTEGEAFSLATASYWTGGTPPYTWSLRSGSLPAGLTLNPSTGVVNGTPTAVGTASVALRVTDTVANMADSNTVELDVEAAASGFTAILDTFSGEDTTPSGHVPDEGPAGLAWVIAAGQLTGGYWAPSSGASNEYVNGYLYDAAGIAPLDNGLSVECTFVEGVGDPTQVARMVAYYSTVPGGVAISRPSLALLELWDTTSTREARVGMRNAAGSISYGSVFTLGGSAGSSITMRLEIEDGAERVYIDGTLRHSVSGIAAEPRIMDYFEMNGSIGSNEGAAATKFNTLTIDPLV